MAVAILGDFNCSQSYTFNQSRESSLLSSTTASEAFGLFGILSLLPLRQLFKKRPAGIWALVQLQGLARSSQTRSQQSIRKSLAQFRLYTFSINLRITWNALLALRTPKTRRIALLLYCSPCHLHYGFKSPNYSRRWGRPVAS